MDDGKKTKKELLVEVKELRRRLAAAEQDCQIFVEGLRQEQRQAEAQWQRRVEDLDAKLAASAAEGRPPLSDEEGDGERKRLLALVQEQTEELQAANEELHVQTEELQAANEELIIQTEELQAANEELIIQTEELRVANEELAAQNEILEQQKAEIEHLARELETEHALLTAVLEQMPASVVIVKAPAGPIILSNHWAERTWGRPLDSGSDLEDFWQVPRYTKDGGVCEKENQPLWRSLTLGEVVVDEELSLRPEGLPPIHLSVSSAPVRDNRGSIVAGVVTHFDITARKRAEETLRASEARYRNLVQLSPDAIIVHAGGKIVFLNMAAVKLLRATAIGDLLGYPIFDLVHPDARDLVKQRVNSALKGDQAPLQELQLLRLDGQAVAVETAASGIVFQGQPAVQVVIRDITERKQAEAERERLLAERDRTVTQLEAVLNSISEGLIISDPQGNIVAMNHAASALWGFESLAEVKRHLSEFPKFMEVRDLSGKVVPWQEWPMSWALRGKTFTNRELRLRRLNDEEEFICSYCGGPVRDKSGRAILGVITIQDITARKQAEAALREGEERLRWALLASGGGAWDWNLTSGEAWWSPEMYRLWGIAPGRQMKLNNSMAIVQEHDRERLGSAVKEAIDQRTDFHCEFRIQHPKHGERWMDSYGRPMYDPAGQAIRLLGITLDITARKQAEAALKESEERYRSIFENSHAVMVLLDPETGAIVDANPAACNYYGYSREELTAKKVTDLNTLPPEQVFAAMRQAREKRQEHFFFHHRLASGEVRDVEVFSGSIRIKEQDLLYSIVHDITARKQAEEALKRARDELELRVLERTSELRDTVAQLLEEVQERQLAQEALRKQAELLELAHEAIIVRDLDSRVIFWNQGATEKYGWTPEEALGRVSHELLATRFPTSREEVDRELVRTGHWQGELVHTRADGKEIIVSSRQAVQRDEHGQPVAILEMNRNVTARRQAEEALAAERQRLLSLLERIPAYVALLREDRTFAYANAEFVRRFGEPAGKYCYELKGLQDACTECEATAVFHTGKPVVRERAGFDGKFYQIYDYPFMDVDGSPLVLEMGVDITARQRAEEQALSLGRMYRMVSKVNEAMVRIGADKDRLFKQVCQIMMDEGDFLLAWIGLVNRGTRQVEAATEYNLDDDYIQNIRIPYDDVPEGHGPTGTAVREGRYDVCNDYAAEPRMAPWREQALARGFRSSAAFPLRVESQVVGVLTVYADRREFFNADEISLLESLADDISYALDFMDKDAKRREAEAALRESEERLRYLASQLLHTQENERRRLAMELHDDLGQSLMVLKLQMRAIEKMVSQDQWQIREECAHCLNYLNSVIDNVRRLSRDLRPAVLEDLGLSSGLRLLAGDFSTYHEVELSMEIDDIEGLFTQEEEINIYRIFQETLTNIAKHAAANQIELVITRDHEVVNFQVKDNGVGFDLEQVLARDPAKKGLGLAALEERVHMLGGELTIESQQDQGTQISIRVPIHSNRMTE